MLLSMRCQQSQARSNLVHLRLSLPSKAVQLHRLLHIHCWFKVTLACSQSASSQLLHLTWKALHVGWRRRQSSRRTLRNQICMSASLQRLLPTSLAMLTSRKLWPVCFLAAPVRYLSLLCPRTNVQNVICKRCCANPTLCRMSCMLDSN